MLLVCRDHLVLGGEPEPREDGRATPRGRLDERDPFHVCVKQLGEAAARHVTQLEHALEVLLAAPPVLEIAPCLLDERVDRRARKRPVRARVQVGESLEDGELRTCLFRRHPMVSSTGA